MGNNFMAIRLRYIYENHRALALSYHVFTGNWHKLSHVRVILSDLRDKRNRPQSNIVHCKAALQWIFSAQNASKVGGVASEYNFSGGWGLPFPEVSGYIIPTMLNSAKQFADKLDTSEIKVRALRVADWLVAIQNADGSYNAGQYYIPDLHGRRPLSQRIGARGKPGAFETGQILCGLSAAYEETADQDYLQAALRAADWLVRQQSPDGSFPVEAQDVPLSYSALTARHLAFLAKITGKRVYQEVAIKNCDWCLSKQHNNGWFDACAHTLSLPPWTHGIAYVVQGLLETGICLGKDEYIEAAMKTAEVLLKIYSVKGFKSVYRQDKGFLPARFDARWRSKDKFSCLVGCAQISLVWSTLYQTTNDLRYLNGALKINDDLKSLQVLESSNAGIRGGTKGSHPIWGLYRSLGYPAEATKFFIDALIAEEQAINKFREKSKEIQWIS